MSKKCRDTLLKHYSGSDISHPINLRSTLQRALRQRLPERDLSKAIFQRSEAKIQVSLSESSPRARKRSAACNSETRLQGNKPSQVLDLIQRPGGASHAGSPISPLHELFLNL